MIVSTAIGAASETQLSRARLSIVFPEQQDPVIPFRFNPAEFTWKKSQTFAEIGIPGLGTPPIQWVRGGAEVVSFDALVDTSDTLESVDTRYVNKVRNLLTPAPRLHAPPIVDFLWGHTSFRGVLDGLTITYLLFDESGVPLRAKLAISLKQYRPVEVRERRSSPQVEKFWIVQVGDTLASIAAEVYRDPALWRVVATANGLTDPRDLHPGLRLLIPRLQ